MNHKRKAHKQNRKEQRRQLVNNPSLLVLLPFKRAMIFMLKKQGVKGITKHTPIGDIAMTFYINNIQGKENSYEVDSFAAIIVTASLELLKHIPDILKWFKERKAKKEAGEQLPPDEEAALGIASKDVASRDSKKEFFLVTIIKKIFGVK